MSGHIARGVSENEEGVTIFVAVSKNEDLKHEGGKKCTVPALANPPQMLCRCSDVDVTSALISSTADSL
jgi:hypothetical protein